MYPYVDGRLGCSHLGTIMNRDAVNIIFTNFVIEVQLIYNIVSVSDGQQSDSIIHKCIFLFSIFFPIIIYYKMLNIGPWAIQQVLVVYFIYFRCLVTKLCLTVL